MTRYFKKLIPFFMAAVLLLLPACSSDGGETGTPANQKDGVDIVATVFPAYDWTREIIGSSDGAELTLLFDKGVDIHSYQMTADDIIKISDCDIFIYVGGESDHWVEDALAEAVNPDTDNFSLIRIMLFQSFLSMIHKNFSC